MKGSILGTRPTAHHSILISCLGKILMHRDFAKTGELYFGDLAGCPKGLQDVRPSNCTRRKTAASNRSNPREASEYVGTAVSASPQGGLAHDFPKHAKNRGNGQASGMKRLTHPNRACPRRQRRPVPRQSTRVCNQHELRRPVQAQPGQPIGKQQLTEYRRNMQALWTNALSRLTDFNLSPPHGHTW